MKILLLSCLMFLLAISALGADSQPVSYKSGDETVNALLSAPRGKGPFPAIVVIHEYWGLNDWVKEAGVEAGRSGLCRAGDRFLSGQSCHDP